MLLLIYQSVIVVELLLKNSNFTKNILILDSIVLLPAMNLIVFNGLYFPNYQGIKA